MIGGTENVAVLDRPESGGFVRVVLLGSPSAGDGGAIAVTVRGEGFAEGVPAPVATFTMSVREWLDFGQRADKAVLAHLFDGAEERPRADRAAVA